MASRQRTTSFRPQLSVRRVYETLQPQSETKELPEAYLLRVYLPGFPRESVKITYVAPSRTVRISGERQVRGTIWHRIDQSYPIPDYCDAEALQGKYEAPVLILTIPKKSTTASQAAPKQQEVGTSQDKGAVADEKMQDATPPQPTTTTKVEEEPVEAQKREDAPSQTPSEPIRDQKGQVEAVERVGSIAEPRMSEKELEQKPASPRSATMQRDEEPQKGEEEDEPKSTPAVTTKIETDKKPEKGQEEFGPRPTTTTLTKVKTAERYQQGQEEFVPRATPAMLTKVKTAEKSQKGQEEIEPKSTPTMEQKIKRDEQPPKGQEEGEPRPAITNISRKPTVKEQLEEKRIEETSGDAAKKERNSKNEAKEEAYESRHEKDKEQADFKEKEKFVAKEAEIRAPKVQKKKEKKGKSEENAVERVGGVSHVFSKVALNEEEKKIATNIGAAVLVIAALGYYLSYRFTS
ncbi:inactive protein RESTRICTED TEV MOVEMENT 2 [Vigna radiata var. radiata]|uniref:Inactive protein RESTRICTED TEV MOVEMENT 2 n=1 Tax=Vigna radiata var. radiata TaxID=3916 RepID=A0A1S3UNN6_VIGRR|nr:inactive protein RESTRICTED TEV MOVEMENT 2 [Vigna radiata var. radiata]